MNDDIRVFDLVTIINKFSVLNQRGGFDSGGIWKVMSIHDDFLVLSRGARILRVKPDGVSLHEKCQVSPIVLDDVGVEDGEE